MNPTHRDLAIVAQKAVATAEALRDGKIEAVRSFSECNRLIADLAEVWRVTPKATPEEKELYLLTGFLIQFTERLGRYMQYVDEPERTARWRHGVDCMLKMINEAASAEAKVSA